jgi:hypothetical protein
MRKSIFKKDKNYTFSDYFAFNYPADEIAKELGYTVQFQILNLPVETAIDPNIIKKLTSAYYELLPKINLNSEIAKREVIIAPLLHALIRQLDVRLNIEYPLNVEDSRLGGSLDYLLRGQQEIVVIEAKKHDLDRGFNQLMAELIALDHYEDSKKLSILYGVITIGDIWRFVQLDRNKKCILRDIHSFRFPEDTRDILAILKGILITNEN